MKHLIIFSLSALSTSALAAEVFFNADVKVKVGSAPAFVEQKSGTSQELKAGSELLILSPKNIPLLIISPESSQSRIDIGEGLLQQVLTEQTRSAVQSATDEIVNGIRKAELHLQKRELSTALETATALKTKYPGVSAVLFTRASILFLLNNKAAAVEDLNEGLKIDPDDEPAKKLLARIGGKEAQ